MSFVALFAVGFGAMLGAWLRWGLGLWLNPVLPALPLGTLAANLLGSYLVGIAVAAFHANSALAPEWRLFIVTGLLGGLTTFSSFSAEVVAQLQRADYLLALGTAVLHLCGSLLLTILGILTVQRLAA
jgi:CrcB protein